MMAEATWFTREKELFLNQTQIDVNLFNLLKSFS